MGITRPLAKGGVKRREEEEKKKIMQYLRSFLKLKNLSLILLQ